MSEPDEQQFFDYIERTERELDALGFFTSMTIVKNRPGIQGHYPILGVIDEINLLDE